MFCRSGHDRDWSTASKESQIDVFPRLIGHDRECGQLPGKVKLIFFRTTQVMIETVDSFQGKQLDVIILSCVRAEAHASGVGFVNDVRRLNVAITRAKRALWILGSAATLQTSPVWRALLADAQQRQIIIEDAHAECA